MLYLSHIKDIPITYFFGFMPQWYNASPTCTELMLYKPLWSVIYPTNESLDSTERTSFWGKLSFPLNKKNKREKAWSKWPLKGMIKMAAKIWLTDRNVMEMLVAVRKLGYLQVIKQVSALSALLRTWIRG